MSADLMRFAYEGAEVRTVVIDGEVWFVAADVAKVLGYSATAAMTRTLDGDEKGVHSLHTPGGSQDFAVVSEPGLFSAILRSRVEGAKQFKRWVTHDLLPTVRRGQAPQALSPQDQMALGLKAAEQIIAEKDSRIAELEPKARTFDTFLNSTGDYSLNEAAKVLSRDHNVLTGERRLLASMVAWGWVYRDGKNKPVPYQAHIDNGRLKAKARFHYHPETGEVVVDAPQVRITAKGLEASLARLTANTLELTS